MKNTLRFASVASSSSGNCTYIGSNNTNILVDVGISGKRTCEGLKNLGVSIEDIDAVFVTHEHHDHVDGLGVVARKYNIPIYATEGTLSNLPEKVGKIRPGLLNTLYPGEKCVINDIFVSAFPIPHDAAEPVGYSFITDNHKVTVATDIGHITKEVKENALKSDILLIESNHDEQMLKNGMYPYHLKKRILSVNGHLSNDDCALFLKDIIKEGTKYVLLGHLSKENNTPALAYYTNANAIEQMGAKIGDDCYMWVAPPMGMTKCIQL